MLPCRLDALHIVQRDLELVVNELLTLGRQLGLGNTLLHFKLSFAWLAMLEA